MYEQFLGLKSLFLLCSTGETISDESQGYDLFPLSGCRSAVVGGCLPFSSCRFFSEGLEPFLVMTRPMDEGN